MCVPPPYKSQEGGFHAPENACMHAVNQISQSISRLNAKELKILPFSLRFPFPSPKRNIHMSVYVPYFSN